MRTALITGYDAAYKPLAALTVPLMYRYCEHHQFDCRVYTSPIIDVPNGIYWTGVCGALEAFRDNYERVIYVDCDQLFTNLDYQIPKQWDFGFHVSKDWGQDAVEPWHFSMCGFVAHRDTIPLFEHALELEPEWRDKPFPEQGTVQAIVKKMMGDLPHMRPNVEGYAGLINVHPRKVFNCVPDQISPGNVPEPWDKSCWCAHLTMVTIENRIKIGKELLRLI